MKYRIFFTTIIIIISCAVIAGVITGSNKFFKSQYTADNIAQSIKDICKNEYKINYPVEIKLSGKTLGAKIIIAGLFGPPSKDGENRKRAVALLDKIMKTCNIDPGSKNINNTWINLNETKILDGLDIYDELEKNLPDLKCPLCISEKALPIVRNFMQAIRRVCLSADLPIDYCTFTLSDPDLKIEKKYTFSLDDLRKAMANWLPGSEYSSFRTLGYSNIENKYAGDKVMTSFFSNLKTGNIIKMFINSFTPKIKMDDLSPNFLNLIIKSSKNNGINLIVDNIKSVQAAEEQRLYNLKIKEYNTNYAEEENVSVHSHEFFVLVNTDANNLGIQKVYSKNKLPENLQKYQDASLWEEKELYVEDIASQDFVMEHIPQISDLILLFIGKINEAYSILYPDKKINLQIPTVNINTKFLPANNNFNPNIGPEDLSDNILELSFKSKKEKKDSDSLPEQLLNLSLWVTKNVCEKYNFYDFQSVKIIDENNKKVLTINKLDLFKKIDTDSLILKTPK